MTAENDQPAVMTAENVQPAVRGKKKGTERFTGVFSIGSEWKKKKKNELHNKGRSIHKIG